MQQPDDARPAVCERHPDRPAASNCARCEAGVCEECGALLGEDVLCPRCARAEQTTAVLPAVVQASPAPVPVRPSRPAPEPASSQMLVGAVAVMAIMLLACIVVIGVLLTRKPPPAPAPPTPERPAAAPSDTAPAEPPPEVPEQPDPLVEPSEELAVTACTRHFPTLELQARIGKQYAEGKFVTAYVGGAPGEFEYQLELEWLAELERYEVVAVKPLKKEPPLAAEPADESDAALPPPPRSPMDVVAEDARFSHLEGVDYVELFNDGRRARVQVRPRGEYATADEMTIELELQDGAWAIVGGAPEP